MRLIFLHTEIWGSIVIEVVGVVGVAWKVVLEFNGARLWACYMLSMQ
jgi:hypothetical protein